MSEHIEVDLIMKIHHVKKKSKAREECRVSRSARLIPVGFQGSAWWLESRELHGTAVIGTSEAKNERRWRVKSLDRQSGQRRSASKLSSLTDGNNSLWWQNLCRYRQCKDQPRKWLSRSNNPRRCNGFGSKNRWQRGWRYQGCTSESIKIWNYNVFEICVNADVSLQMQGIPEPLRDHMCWNFTFMLRIAFWQTSVVDLDGWLGTQCVGRPEVRLGRLVTDSSSCYTSSQILLTHYEEFLN